MRRFSIRCACRSHRSLRLLIPVALAVLLVPALALAAGNGKLQIHHIDVGQGDGILLVTPLGQAALFDDGTYTDCSGIKSYLQGQGITSLDYHFCTHYHADHIGCIDDLAVIGITVTVAGYDRGYSYSSATYTNYVNTLGALRQTIAKGQTITLDAGAANPVAVTCVDLNGAGVYSPTGSDENAKSVVYLVTYGAFNEVIGGDLTGDGSTDVETTVGPMVGDVEVYKVHHHGSAYSSNDNWLTATAPEVGVISVGSNSYGHPTSSALTRLHNHGVYTYWTEVGSGASPDPQWDKVGGTIVVQADPGAGAAYSVSGSGFTDTYYNDGGTPPVVITETLVASSVAMLFGTVTGGSVSSLAADDGSRMTVTAAKSGKKYTTDWYGAAVLAHPPTKLTVTYDGSYSASRTQKLYLWDWAGSAWNQVDSYTVGTGDVTRTYTTTSPGDFVSGAGEVRLRVQGSLNSKTYTCRADYMAFTYDYLQGTLVARGAADLRPAPAPSEEGAPTAGARIALAVAPNPASRSTRFQLTLSREADVRLEVFDLAGRRVATPFAGRARPGATSVPWMCTEDDGSPLPAGIYFARFEGLGLSVISRMVVLGR